MDRNIEEQFLRSYKEYSDALFRFCYLKVSDREVAKDMLQETFIKTWQYIQKGGTVTNPKSFLYKTAQNLVIDHYRKKKTVSLDALADDGFDPGENPTKQTEDRLDGELALEVMNKIPEMYREVIFMQYVEGLSIKEIAEIVGESENNVSVRIHRGIEKLRTIYENQNNQNA